MPVDRDPAPRAHSPAERTSSGSGSLAARLNWLRAGVLGANDGVISTAGLVIGVAAASSSRTALATAGIAGLVSGAVSMALGEYVSVSTQRDTERAEIAKEVRELREMPDEEHRELVHLLRQRGLSESTSKVVADELSAHDALNAHLQIEVGLDREELTNPWAAAGSSAAAFTVGALLPLIAILVPPEPARIAVTFVAVLIGLSVTGIVSARLGGAPARAAVLRLVGGGAAAMAVTFAIGELIGVAVG